MKHKKMDVFSLESLLESAKIAEKISEGMVDESVYNVLSKEGSLFESLENNEVKAILENGSEIKTNMPDVDELDAEVKKAFGLLESEFSNIDFTELKGKKVLIKTPRGEFEVRVVDADPTYVRLQSMNGTASQKFSNTKFRDEMLVKVLTEAESTDTVVTSIEEPKKEVVMEAKKEEVKSTVVESSDKKEDVKLGDGMDGTKPALGKEESPVKDDKKVVENPTGELTTEHVVEFKHQAPVEHSKFVADALSARNDGLPKAQKKFPKNVVETKLLEHGAKFESFVNSFKTPETQQLLECILEGYGVCLEAQKKLIGKVKAD